MWHHVLRIGAYWDPERSVAPTRQSKPSCRGRPSSGHLNDLVNVLLHFDEAVEFAFFVQEFFVSADFGDFAIFQNEQARGVAQSAQAMRDGESSAALDQGGN